MGCDIHIHTEIVKNINGTEIWVNGDFYQKNPVRSFSLDGEKFEKVDVFKGRDYRLFSILADVRSDGNNSSISQPKGLPNDVTEEVQTESDYWGIDGHSHSFLTLDELKKYIDENPTIVCEGFISQEQAEKLDQGILPNSWSGWTSNKTYVKRKWNQPNHSLMTIISALEERGSAMYVYDPNKIRIVFWFDN